MVWKDLSMSDRLSLLKDRRQENPEYTYFNLRSEFDDGKTPYGIADTQPQPAKFSVVNNDIDYTNFIKNQLMNQQIDTVDNSGLFNNQKIVDYGKNSIVQQPLKATEPAIQNIEWAWEIPTYNNSNYRPSKDIVHRITNWEGKSMKTNTPISIKSKELGNILRGYNNYFSPQQLDYLTSYYYNIRRNSFLPTLNQIKKLPNAKTKNDYDNVMNSIAKSINVGYNDRKRPGLKTRRIAEQIGFLNGYK